MPRFRVIPAAITGSRIRGAGVIESADSDEAVVQPALRDESSHDFETFLAELSSALSAVAPEDLQHEICRWLDQLARQVGAEHCTVSEFYDAEEKPRFLLRWEIGSEPEAFLPQPRAWIQHKLTGGQVISISSLDDLPAEASSTRARFEEMGIRSGIWIPMLAEGSGVGGMSLSMLGRERVWPQQTLQRCWLVANVFANALLRLKRSAEIEERIEFERITTEITARFMCVGEVTDALIDEVLSELGEFLMVDRIAYLEVDHQKGSLTPTRLWTSESAEDDQFLINRDLSPNFQWLTKEIVAGRPVTISHLDEFPEEAKYETQYCEHLGVQSFTMVPAQIDGTPVAALALDNIRERRYWDDQITARLQIVASIIASAQERVRAQQHIKELRRFEDVVTEVSTAFVNLPPDRVDDEIETALGLVAKTLGADVISLLQPCGRNGYDITHEWSSEKIASVLFKGRKVEDEFPWLAKRLRENETIAISKLSEFPGAAEAERAALERVGLQSVLFVPFNVRGKLAGHLAIDTIRQQTWSNALAPRLKLLGEVFGEATVRRDAEVRLRESFKEINVLKRQLQEENVILRQEVKLTCREDEIVGDSAAMRIALTKAQQVAATDSTVLILGETGTGKELLARAIHKRSSRKEELMVTVNCAALPQSLVEAELFGREKGAYTGALSRELGRFEIAGGSTILLDEIGELSLELQAKLLRVLEEGEFERLGSSKTIKVDVRVLASTNRNLVKAVEAKDFREDLYYRLNVFPIELPPLRDRSEDIPQLVWTFVQEFSETMGKTIQSIPVAAMDSLKAHRWPGNVREVRNIVERAMIVSQGPVLEMELPGDAAMGRGYTVSSRRLTDVEREHIRAVVESTGWRIRGSGGAAEILGLKPTTLEARMKKLGLERSNMK